MSSLLDQYPDVSFLDMNNVTLQSVKDKIISDFQNKYTELTGTAMSLGNADPIRLILYSAALQIYQGFEMIDFAGKMGFLKYSYGDFLENLGALKGITRNDAAAAVCTVRFSLSAVRASATSIPAGTRLTTQAADVYFATDEYAEIPIGQGYVDVVCTCLTAGEAGNGIAAGDISIMVDPVPYIASVSNLGDTSGGTDIESDESLKERIYLAPANYSVAGPEAAYEYFVREAYPDVGDVKVTSPSECEVKIYVIGKDGNALSDDVLQTIEDYLNQSNIKPMTDRVTVKNPTQWGFNVIFAYYINKSDADRADEIQAAVQEKLQEYVLWQTQKIGRDIEPGKMVQYIMSAGIKRIVNTYPQYTQIGDTSIPTVNLIQVTYGGLADD